MGAPKLDMIGKRFSRLLVLRFHGSIKNRHHWICQCDCGNQCIVAGKKLRSGHTKSCSCLQKEKAAARLLTHGKSYDASGKASREYSAWLNMKQRVLNPKNDEYHNYGLRGIAICERWLNSFQNFYEDLGPCPAGLELDRIDVDGNYEPDNCRWASEIIQRRNQRKYIQDHGLEAVYA